jgi:hypothetical protein
VDAYHLPVYFLRAPEICKLARASLVEKDVGRLYIPVNHIISMEVLNSFKYLFCVDLNEGLIHWIGLVYPLQ